MVSVLVVGCFIFGDAADVFLSGWGAIDPERAAIVLDGEAVPRDARQAFDVMLRPFLRSQTRLNVADVAGVENKYLAAPRLAKMIAHFVDQHHVP